MKKIIPLLLIVCLLGSFAACGSKQTEQVAIITPEPLAQTETADDGDSSVAIPDLDAAAQTGEQDSEETADEDTGDSQVSRANDNQDSEDNNSNDTNSNSNNNSNSNTENNEPAAEEEKDLYSIAAGYTGSSLSALQGAVGSPNSQEYVISCIDDAAQEGMLYYDGFVVWTIQYNDGTEIVNGVSPN